MAASGNQKNKSSGLRILWIPGRKRHGHKGRYDTTRKQIDYSPRQKNTNEPWALGGNKGFEKLIDSDIPGTSEGPSRVLNALPATYTLAAGASTTTAMKLDEGNQFAMLDDKDDRDPSNEMDVKRNESNSGPNKTAETQKKDFNKSDRDDRPDGPDKKDKENNKKANDVNSIESLHEKKLKDSSFDITDSSLYLHKYNGKKKNKKKKKRNGEEEEDDPDAAAVKCLYYTLMCCECSIS